MWTAEENYWPGASEPYPFDDASGPGSFERLHERSASHYGRPGAQPGDQPAEDTVLMRGSGLDPDRLRLHRLAQYLSLVAGPLRLLAGGFPDRDAMLRIVTANVGRVLGEL
jgi:hypothetical protein